MVPEIVPPEILVPPDASKGFHSHDAALVVDGWLRRLAGQDAEDTLNVADEHQTMLAQNGQREKR